MSSLSGIQSSRRAGRQSLRESESEAFKRTYGWYKSEWHTSKSRSQRTNVVPYVTNIARIHHRDIIHPQYHHHHTPLLYQTQEIYKTHRLMKIRLFLPVQRPGFPKPAVLSRPEHDSGYLQILLFRARISLDRGGSKTLFSTRGVRVPSNQNQQETVKTAARWGALHLA